MFVFRRVIIYVIFHKFWICHFLWRVSLCPNLPWPHEGYCKLNHNILYDILLREVSTDVFPNRSTRGNPRKITSKFHHPHKSVEIKKWPNFQLDDSHFQDLVTLVLPAISSKGFSRTHRVPRRAPTSSCMGELHGTKKPGGSMIKELGIKNGNKNMMNSEDVCLTRSYWNQKVFSQKVQSKIKKTNNTNKDLHFISLYHTSKIMVSFRCCFFSILYNITPFKRCCSPSSPPTPLKRTSIGSPKDVPVPWHSTWPFSTSQIAGWGLLKSKKKKNSENMGNVGPFFTCVYVFMYDDIHVCICIYIYIYI